MDQAVKNIESKGGKNVVPKISVFGVGYVAYCSDPDGNTFGVFQADQAA